ncbi:L,D-transpeptidase [Streptomyces sp. NPDC002889]|uniref:L,D-transpeptidase family protein n=1 Tax=Streptomyces sp. NPDC002889 TaxID=3364669 RepID=UPI00368A8784
MLPSSRSLPAVLAVAGAISLVSACGGQEPAGSAASVPSVSSGARDGSGPSSSARPSASTSASASPSTSASASASAKASASASPTSTASRAQAGSGAGGTADKQSAAPAAPSFPVPVTVGNATQVITVKASGSYATVTAWTKGASGWKAVISASGRVGSNGVVNGATRKQGTYTTPSGTYSITEGFGVEAGGTSMPYTKVNSTHWWVQDPESKFYNSMHTAAGADFPLTESGERGSEHLVNYPTQYAKALVINFNRWPAVPGRGAGIFLHVNGRGATAGCVSVPRATMDRIMGWIKPSAHPRIAIG